MEVGSGLKDEMLEDCTAEEMIRVRADGETHALEIAEHALLSAEHLEKLPAERYLHAVNVVCW